MTIFSGQKGKFFLKRKVFFFLLLKNNKVIRLSMWVCKWSLRHISSWPLFLFANYLPLLLKKKKWSLFGYMCWLKEKHSPNPPETLHSPLCSYSDSLLPTTYFSCFGVPKLRKWIIYLFLVSSLLFFFWSKLNMLFYHWQNGVRGLMLDMYDFNNDIWLCHSTGGKCYNLTAFVSASVMIYQQ